VYESFNQLYRTGVPVKAVEIKIIRKDGSIGVSELSVILMHDTAGKPVGFAGLSRDVSERKQMEEKIRQSEERYRSILENMQESYFENDLEGRLTFVNDTACKHLGYTKEELLGTMSSSLQDEAAGRKTYQAYSQLYKTGRSIKLLESEFIRKDGSRGLYELSVDLIRDSQGKPRGFRGVSRDITGRIQAEQEMKKAKEAAEAASAAKSEFLANMSHEIRTPMNGVIGMTGLLLDTELTDEQRRYAEIVHGSGELLLGLINNILDFSKLEAMKLDLESLDFDLSILLEDFAATLALPAHEKGLELICAADLDVPTQLRGDPGRLRQILANLAGNAVKFTQTGEVGIRVSLMETNENDVLLRFSVRDTGIGIPKDKLALLFNKFSQVDASTTRRYGGTGLGLVISKQLAELQGGKTGVISEEGKGSDFWFTARLGKQAGDARVQSVPPADLRDVRVLIVDDNATNREILTTRLTSWGMRTSEAQDGPRAIQRLYRARDENAPFRIAVIDMQMPGMDGEMLGRIIKADKRLADTKMVMLTSLGSRGEARQFHEVGFAAYATKPIRHQELKTILSMVLAGQNEMASAPWSIVTRHTALKMQNTVAGRRGRILLAEDNITNQQVALGILKKLGLHADAVANGVEALNALETIPYDLVLMDVQMPEMDGITATAKIRTWKTECTEGGVNQASNIKWQASGIPIIAMTAYAMQGDRERCIEAGMNDYVSKPVSAQALADALEKWLPASDRIPSPGGNIPVDAGRACGLMGSSGDQVMTPPGESFSSQDPLVAVFDKADMLVRLMNDEDLARVVAEGFLEDIPDQLALLEGCLKAKDVQGVVRQAHSIKGASANVSGQAVSDLAFAIEKAGKQGDLDEAGSFMAPLVLQFERLKRAMTQEMKLNLKGEPRKDAAC
jgi:PAS domain S-box-containing protein